jgi:pimeloyl-ACP methyl ester carboxylesterase
VDLFVREFGPVDAPAIVFLHGGHLSGWAWEPVVRRMHGYRCLVPDLPQFGRSQEQGRFDMGRSADAVAQLIRSRVGTGRAHLVGYSLGAQVGLQLLATEPKFVERAVLCGSAINPLPAVRLTQQGLGALARTIWFRGLVKRYWGSRKVEIPPANVADYRRDVRLITGVRLADIVVASAGFTLPATLRKADTPTLFITGAKEGPVVRGWSAALAGVMPQGVDTVATGMRHDWPLRHPDLFARTIDGWLAQTTLPREIVQLGMRTGRPAA